ncbi:MAG: GatB/YqeY domain-containing protein [Patescibacteria group bacterium]
MLKEQLREELKQAMFAKDETKKSVLRMLISAIGYFEIEKGGAGYEATEQDVMDVIGKQAKQRRDSIEQFTTAGRTELVENETKELAILQSYLPQQMGEEEIKTLVKEAIAATGATTSADMGKVMGALMPKTKGKADGALVSKIVRESLA